MVIPPSIAKGARISWQYVHATSSRTRFFRTKHGTFIRYSGAQAVVRFDGNRSDSRVEAAKVIPFVDRAA